ncbi:MAG: hypothetical protein K2Q45_02490 [Nitrosomonas sp.]|nr:hypothetical protein [Nitrosomonas sp.]
MVQDRGYIMPHEIKSPEQYISDFCAYDEQGRCFVQRELLSLALVHRDEYENAVRVFFLEPLGKKTGKDGVKQLLERLGERTRAIFILPHGAEMTAHAVKLIDSMNRGDKKVLLEFFSEAQLSTNITQVGRLHRTYKVLSPAEKQQVNAKYGAKIPKIAYDDPLARYYGLQYGDMLRLERSSESAGLYGKPMQCLYPEQLPKDTKMQKKKI